MAGCGRDRGVDEIKASRQRWLRWDARLKICHELVQVRQPRPLGHTGRWSQGWQWRYRRWKLLHDVGLVEYEARGGLEDQLVCAIELKDEIFLKEFVTRILYQSMMFTLTMVVLKCVLQYILMNYSVGWSTPSVRCKC